MRVPPLVLSIAPALSGTWRDATRVTLTGLLSGLLVIPVGNLVAQDDVEDRTARALHPLTLEQLRDDVRSEERIRLGTRAGQFQVDGPRLEGEWLSYRRAKPLESGLGGLTTGPQGPSRPLPLSDIMEVQVWRGRAGQGALIGGLIGLASGAALGVALQSLFSSSSSMGDDVRAAGLVGGIGALSGATVGGGVGALASGWKTVFRSRSEGMVLDPDGYPIDERQIRARERDGGTGALVGGALGSVIGAGGGYFILHGSDAEFKDVIPALGALALGAVAGSFLGSEFAGVSRAEAIEQIREERREAAAISSEAPPFELSWQIPPLPGERPSGTLENLGAKVSAR